MIEIIFLGIVQGITEFLPVSSSAHLALLENFLSLSYDPVSLLFFDVMLHLATALAVLVFFAKDWWYILLKRHDLLKTIILANIPAGIIGIILSKTGLVESLRHPLFIAGFLVLGSAIMQWGESRHKAGKEAVVNVLKDDVSLRDGLFVGFMQVFALLPGVSRSGATISAGFASGFERHVATKFSFLLATPLIVAGSIYEIYKYVDRYQSIIYVSAPNFISPLVVLAGAIAAFLSGMFAIKYLLKFLNRGTLNNFITYRIGLAMFVILYFLFETFVR